MSVEPLTMEQALAIASETEIAQKGMIQGSQNGKRTPETIAIILKAISEGATEAIAAGLAGLNPSTLSLWKREDTKLSTAVMNASYSKAHKRIQAIEELGNAKADWKAHAFLLQHDPATKEIFSKNDSGNRNINITINVPRDGEQPIIIEGEND